MAFDPSSLWYGWTGKRAKAMLKVTVQGGDSSSGGTSSDAQGVGWAHVTALTSGAADEAAPLGSASNPLNVTGSSSANAANITPAQVSVGTSATLLAAARAGRQSITVVNEGTTAIRFGPAGVTTGTGALLPGVVGASVTLSFTGALYGVVASGTQTVSVVELY